MGIHENLYACGLCEKSFSIAKSLVDHVNKIHVKPSKIEPKKEMETKIEHKKENTTKLKSKSFSEALIG